MMKLVIVVTGIVLFNVFVVAQRRGCNVAEQQIYKARDWDALWHSYTRYTRCGDDGEIAESYDEVVGTKLLLEKWDTLPQLAALIDRDKQFKDFVLKHISLTALSTEDLKKLRIKAVQHCPDVQTELCNDIRGRVQELEQEDAHVQRRSGHLR